MKYILLLLLGIIVSIVSIYLYKKNNKKQVEHIGSNSVSLSNFVVNNVVPEKVFKNFNCHIPRN